jgi:hypothetical protein
MTFNAAAKPAWIALLALAGSACQAQAVLALDSPEWVEEAIAPPATFSTSHLIPIDMPLYVSLKIGVDPESISVGGDGVVRYVVVMTNSAGNNNVLYEGIRCTSDEVKTYARLGSSGHWSIASNPQWKAVTDNMPSRHAQAFARQGACQNRLATSKQEIIAALRDGPQTPTRAKLY